ncbi:MAG: hypothetical protein JNJ54_04800 [Myxococcaceae bacterium]|nr:hypothetical protein [Myxococcaceae bacterium]
MEAQPLPVSPAVAFTAFCDVAAQRRWVPGLKKVKVVRTDAAGRGLEVFYEFGESLAYALVYAWDDVHHKARWVPSSGVRDGVSGSVWFEPTQTGCVMHYHLEALKGRPPEHERDVMRAFADWLTRR